jgi:hypothetical protein
MEKDGPNCFDLEQVSASLALHPAVQVLIKQSISDDQYDAAIQLMRDGRFEEGLGWSIHDLLTDAIRNDAEIVWSGLIHGSEDDYPVNVNEYNGIFWVWAMEYDPIGYFTDKEAAIAYAMSTWEEVHEVGKESEEDYGYVKCPYCGSPDSCEHLLLTVDVTFRRADGGLLMKIFNSRWEQLFETHSEGMEKDERPFFAELIEEVDSLADAQLEYAQEGGPGQSSDYEFYYCSTGERATEALARFKSV